MDIQYTLQRGLRESTEIDPIAWWLSHNLEQGGIEQQISKMRMLLALIGEHWLTENKDRLDDMVDAVGCEGYHHKLVNNE